MHDPQAVSKCIGCHRRRYLAVVYPVFYNDFNERVERVNEQLNVAALDRAGQIEEEDMAHHGGTAMEKLFGRAVVA